MQSVDDAQFVVSRVIILDAVIVMFCAAELKNVFENSF